MSGYPVRGLTTAIFAAILIACSDSPAEPPYEPRIDPANFVAAVTNPFFPLVPGTSWYYEGQTPEGLETNTVEVLAQNRTVAGIAATVVHDRVYLDGDLIEETFDWYAQDDPGNVWYLGEDSREIENGRVVSTAGSWETGVDNAKPGIIMWADPGAHIGESYRQEYYRGEAEDWARVLSVNEAVDVPYGRMTGCTRTEDWNALERDVVEQKYYCPAVGMALEVLVRGGNERVQLVRVTR